MCHIAVHFDVRPEHRDEFIAAALEDGRNSGRDEPGTQRFELIVDEENPNPSTSTRAMPTQRRSRSTSTARISRGSSN